ncbi:Type I restriction-modification system, specificity subunit S [uncultured Gammaproteobacteria bacterium]|nr:Type I restriction-modification system, specificity subunit S [uncultured Gammaproteobacteria bacterium]
MNENKPLPKGWEVKNLGEVCEVEYGTRVVRKRDGGTIFPVYGGGGATFFMDTFNREDCLVVARFAMSEKCTRFVKGKLFLNDSGLSVKTKNDKEINQEFLNLQFLHLNDYIYSLARGAAQKNLNVPIFRKLEIHYPRSLKAQKRIVAILDKTFAEITKAEAIAKTNLQNAKELFESYLNNVFENKGDDWEEKTLEQISDVFGRGKSKHRPRNDKKLYDGNYPFIQTGDIRNCDHYISKYSQTYNELGLSQSKLWPKGTICITIAANIAETGVLSFDACFPDSVIGVVVNKKVADLDFVEYLLQFFKVNIQALGKGSAQSNINMGTFQGKTFPFPKSLKVQKQIVNKLDHLQVQTKKLKANYSKQLKSLEELKKSILQKAFNGEL